MGLLGLTSHWLYPASSTPPFTTVPEEVEPIDPPFYMPPPPVVQHTYSYLHMEDAEEFIPPPEYETMRFNPPTRIPDTPLTIPFTEDEDFEEKPVWFDTLWHLVRPIPPTPEWPQIVPSGEDEFPFWVPEPDRLPLPLPPPQHEHEFLWPFPIDVDEGVDNNPPPPMQVPYPKPPIPPVFLPPIHTEDEPVAGQPLCPRPRRRPDRKC